ncbi:MAG TPA: hypothetical protein VMW66_04335, partial [Elusimicrobiales bacterium]|nr:hypothetical protein [Elusimicrobiales bacterium]
MNYMFEKSSFKSYIRTEIQRSIGVKEINLDFCFETRRARASVYEQDGSPKYPSESTTPDKSIRGQAQ